MLKILNNTYKAFDLTVLLLWVYPNDTLSRYHSTVFNKKQTKSWEQTKWSIMAYYEKKYGNSHKTENRTAIEIMI